MFFPSEKMEILSSLRFTSCSRVREKVGCRGNFPEVYDKVNRRGRTGKQIEIEFHFKSRHRFFNLSDVFCVLGTFREFQDKVKKKFGKYVD